MTTKIVCSECQSDNILQDAWVDPNYGDVVTLMEEFFCIECDGACWVEEVEVDDEES